MEFYSLNVKSILEIYELIKATFYEDFENYILNMSNKTNETLKTKIKQVEMDI